MSNFQNKINKKEKGIWRYAKLYNEFIKSGNRLSLNDSQNEGDTSTCRLQNNVAKVDLPNINHLYFKREDENITGSLKDRSLAYQVSLVKQNNKNKLVISTSGNAGIAAAAYCQKAKIKLYIFISPETEKAKIVEMQKYNPIIIKSKRAIRLANYLAAKYKIENLRPSINNSSIEGFKSIAFEIFENLGEMDVIFTFVTSGSSFIGIGRAYKYLLKSGGIKKLPKLFAVQSGKIFSIASEFEKIQKQESNAGKLGAKNTKRKNEIIELIKLSEGKGIYVTDREIQEATKLLEKNNINTSSEGCASFAGIIKASRKNKFNRAVCILSGKARVEVGEIDESKIYKAENFGEVDEIVSSI